METLAHIVILENLVVATIMIMMFGFMIYEHIEDEKEIRKERKKVERK